jgi:hypothetical protein
VLDHLMRDRLIHITCQRIAAMTATLFAMAVAISVLAAHALRLACQLDGLRRPAHVRGARTSSLESLAPR